VTFRHSSLNVWVDRWRVIPEGLVLPNQIWDLRFLSGFVFIGFAVHYYTFCLLQYVIRLGVYKGFGILAQPSKAFNIEITPSHHSIDRQVYHYKIQAVSVLALPAPTFSGLLLTCR